ncbi:at-rich interactive domain-containing protein 3 [Quercus suber]|uniref:At-rich interactive domain-containing protein 3 n=1 Tax=Quercus suber TaxID=58331 RepID=A0AAW0LWR9_QUESU
MRSMRAVQVLPARNSVQIVSGVKHEIYAPIKELHNSNFPKTLPSQFTAHHWNSPSSIAKQENEERGNEDMVVAVASDDEGRLLSNPYPNAQVDEHESHKAESPYHSVPEEGTPIPAQNGTPPSTEIKAASPVDDNNIIESQSNNPGQPAHDFPPSQVPLRDHQDLVKPEPNTHPNSDVKIEDDDLPQKINSGGDRNNDNKTISTCHLETAEPAVVIAKTEHCQSVPEAKIAIYSDTLPTTTTHNEPATPCAQPSDIKSQIFNGIESDVKVNEQHVTTPVNKGNSNSKHSLWRAVCRLGGYDKVTSCKLWRQVGESFKPPKTCTTVSWTFRGFYEKALLDYERHRAPGGELNVPIASHSEPSNIENQASGSGRARRDAAARAMQGWHSQRLLGNGEVSDPIIKDKNSISMQKREKQLKSIGLLKRKKPSYMEHTVKTARTKASKPQLDTPVVDIGAPADWVKINVQKTKDCFEVYALVPGLLREEVVSLPSRIDPHQTSAVVTLHGQLFVRVPFEESE